MPRLVSALLVMALAAGCSTRSGAKIGALSGVGIIGVGLWVRTIPGGETEPKDLAPIPLAIGTTILALSLYVYFTTKDEVEVTVEPPKPLPPDPHIAARAKAREDAWVLTKQAMTARRANDCELVVRLEVTVRELDVEFYADVFARDRGIARCLSRP